MSLNEYQQNLEKFYKLKNKYNEKINREKAKLISNPDLSRKERKIKFNQNVYVCINCKNKGGTIFESNKDFYKVICGNTEKPCNINLYFKRIHKDLLDNLLIEQIDTLTKLKEKIIKIKLDYMLGFLTEEDSIVNFSTVKKELNDNYEKYREQLQNYVKITNNTENIEDISNKNDEKIKYINEIKSKIEKYKFNNNSSEIKEIIEIYTNDLVKCIKELRELKYKNYYLYTNIDNKHIMKKDLYSLMDLETQINN
tara:strand:- start:701 stop:1462 length:762 start_codon:yes stop_codon:yes gene_type:complete